MRDYIADGTITGSKVITSGKILSPTTKGNSSFGTLYKEVDSPSEMTVSYTHLDVYKRQIQHNVGDLFQRIVDIRLCALAGGDIPVSYTHLSSRWR